MEPGSSTCTVCFVLFTSHMIGIFTTQSSAHVLRLTNPPWGTLQSCRLQAKHYLDCLFRYFGFYLDHMELRLYHSNYPSTLQPHPRRKWYGPSFTRDCNLGYELAISVLTRHEEDSEDTISIDLDTRYLAAILLHML